MLTQKELPNPVPSTAESVYRTIKEFFRSLNAPGSLTLEVESIRSASPPVYDLSPAGSVFIPADFGMVVPDHYTVAPGQALTIATDGQMVII